MDLDKTVLNISELPQDAEKATKCVVEALFKIIWPLILQVRRKLQVLECEDDTTKVVKEEMFTLCCSQIKKCLSNIFEIFKLEHRQQIILQESRHCITERLNWCIHRLKYIEQSLDKIVMVNCLENKSLDESLFAVPMYFVNWIDHAFEILTKLSDLIYKSDCKDSTELCELWRGHILECVSDLHVCLDELLLSAMTLCKYCLLSDQYIVKARCQVVLRETKALLSELVTGDADKTLKVTKNSLKLPLMPSNINVLIDVLKDVLYALETNTNTALLALLVHCFSNTVPPVEYLRTHLRNGSNRKCPCMQNCATVIEDCSYIKEFDLYNERLLQIGSFAVSCSSDQNRILTLRSGLASLEALDPHLVPALMLSADSLHATLMTTSWHQEVQEIRDSVFLIVDPAAFAEKSKQMMHQQLLQLMEANCYNNKMVCAVINIGSVMKDFFAVYKNHEPDALTHHEKLIPLLADLSKVQLECKIVCNLLSSEKDILYEVKKPLNSKQVSFEQLMKRLKLLYTIVNRINNIFHPKDNDDELFVDEIYDEKPPIVKRNITHVLQAVNTNTYVNSPCKPVTNASRSIFARTANMRSITNELVSSRLSKHLKMRRREELSFSMQLDELIDSSKSEKLDRTREVISKQVVKLREPSVLYNFSSKRNRSSLRMAVLNRNCKFPVEAVKSLPNNYSDSVTSDNGLMDENTSLQITEILDQMNDMSNMFALTKPSMNSSCAKSVKQSATPKPANIWTLNNNNQNTTICKQIWNIPVNSTVDEPLNETAATSNVSNTSSQPSNFSTLERLNDLNVVESKLNDLMILQQETSL